MPAIKANNPFTKLFSSVKGASAAKKTAQVVSNYGVKSSHLLMGAGAGAVYAGTTNDWQKDGLPGAVNKAIGFGAMGALAGGAVGFARGGQVRRAASDLSGMVGRRSSWAGGKISSASSSLSGWAGSKASSASNWMRSKGMSASSWMNSQPLLKSSLSYAKNNRRSLAASTAGMAGLGMATKGKDDSYLGAGLRGAALGAAGHVGFNAARNTSYAKNIENIMTRKVAGPMTKQQDFMNTAADKARNMFRS